MSSANVSVYAGGPIMPGYTGSPPNSTSLMSELAASGFTTVVGFTIWVETEVEGTYKDGDLTFNHLKLATNGSDVIVSEGVYGGPTDWATQLQTLKEGNVTKIFFSTLGRFSRIQSLIAKHGTGSDSVLYKNFKSLKDALGIDGIDLDDEDLWHHDTTVQFSQMLNTIGYEVSFCPYSSVWANYWAGCLAALNTGSTPDLVSGFNLQCYDGGNPADLQSYIDAIQNSMDGWTTAQAAAFVTPGFWCLRGKPGEGNINYICVGSTPADIEAQYKIWQTKPKPTGSLQGGFIYILDSLVNAEAKDTCNGPSMSDYATCIATYSQT